MEKKKLQALLTDLIQMDLINCKLCGHFRLMGVDIEDYALGIDRIVFEFLNIQDRPDSDEIFERYMEEYKSIMDMHVKQDSAKIERLAKSLFEMLEGYANKAF